MIESIIEEFTPVLYFIIYTEFGAMARAAFGIYKAYTNLDTFTLDKKRIGWEIIASMFFGTFSMLLLQKITKLPFNDLNILALIAGFLGADGVSLLTKKIGLTKGLQIIVAKEQLKYVGLNERQINALQYLKTNKTITNEIYQKMNSTTRTTAKRDLTELVNTGKIRKTGIGKSTYYILA